MTIQPGERELENLRALLDLARAEDLGEIGDVTSCIVSEDAKATGHFVAREPMVVCGVSLLETIGAAYDEQLRTEQKVQEGEFVDPGAQLAIWCGSARAMLAAERVALNFFQRLSGVASTAHKYVRAVAGTPAQIYDTRKTTPGWRVLEKYAVRVGGANNHRMGLYDAMLIKDNHLGLISRAPDTEGVAAVARELERVRPLLKDLTFVELEVDTIEQLEIALALPVDIIMLDNMSVEELRTAVRMRDEAGAAGRIKLEASGGITLSNIRCIAETGVEMISVGALTHSSAAADISLEVEAG